MPITPQPPDQPSPESAITAILAEAPSITEAFPSLLQTLCEGFGWDLGEAWLVMPDTGLMQLRAIWHVPGIDAGEWLGVYRGIGIGKGIGLGGRAWDQGQSQWLSDISSDPDFLRAAQAAKLGLKAVCALPLRVEDHVIGAVALFSREIRDRDDQFLDRLAGPLSQIARLAQAYAAANRSERFLADLINSASDIMAILRVDGTIEFESQSVEKILGYRLEERIGKNVFDFVHPDDIAAALDAFQAAVQNVGVSQTVEVRARHRDGSWIWLESAGTVRQVKSGLVAMVASRDVTARKSSSDEIARHRESLDGARLTGLTEGEVRVVRLVARGLSNKEIAGALNLSPHTVKEYVSKASRKLGARSRAHVAAVAARQGLA